MISSTCIIANEHITGVQTIGFTVKTNLVNKIQIGETIWEHVL